MYLLKLFDMVFRRDFLIGAGGIAVGATGVEAYQRAYKSETHLDSFQESDLVIDLKLFPTDEFLQEGRTGLRNAELALKKLIPSLSSARTNVGVSIETNTDILIEENLPQKDEDEYLTKMGDYLSDTGRSVAQHSNVILRTESNSENSGIGDIGSSDDPAVSVLFDAGYLHSKQPSLVGGGPTSSWLRTLVHEVGHNIGLTHNMGNAWIDKDDLIGTMMVNIGDIKFGETNKFDQQIPEEDEFLNYRQEPVWNTAIKPRRDFQI